MTTKMADREIKSSERACVIYHASPSTESFSRVIARGSDLLPFSLGLSAVACGIAHYGFGVSFNDVPILVSVPLVTGYVFLRGFVAAVSGIGPAVKEPSTDSARLPIFAVAIFTSIVGTFGLLTAGPIYYYLGFRQFSRYAFIGAASLFCAMIVLSAVAICVAMAPAIHRKLTQLLILGFMQVVVVPRNCMHKLRPGL